MPFPDVGGGVSGILGGFGPVNVVRIWCRLQTIHPIFPAMASSEHFGPVDDTDRIGAGGFCQDGSAQDQFVEMGRGQGCRSQRRDTVGTLVIRKQKENIEPEIVLGIK